MKIRAPDWHWMVLAIVIFSVLHRAYAPSDGMIDAQRSLKATRLALQEQGFKTDLTNFDFSTSPELRDRMAILQATAPNRNSAPFIDYPDLMETAGGDRVVVVWTQNSLRRQNPAWPSTSYELTWEDFREVIGENAPELDAAIAAILAGPMQFNLDASAGNYMLLPHLALLKNLTLKLNDRAMLALHDGNREAAWTNLLAATRLVTAWNPEPATISHQVRFGNAKLVYAATWQVLQTNGWTDDQLARLQHEWESADFLTRLPEIQAFQRASDFRALEQDESALQNSGAETNSGVEPYGDEERLLRFYRDREIEYRQAVQAGNWRQMRAMPGVTNELFFTPHNRHGGRFAMALNQRRMRRRFEGQGTSFLGQAAEDEAERRILITAIALERYNGRHGQYPRTLEFLAPEFLKSVPMDFMNGEALHYQVAADGRFVLYSVGLDGIDNGGKMPTPASREEQFARLRNPNLVAPESDIVWPLAAGSAKVVAFRQDQSQAEAERKAQREAAAKVQEQRQSEAAEAARQAAMKRLLADKPSLGKEPVYQGKPLSVWVMKAGQNADFTGPPNDAVAAIRAIGHQAVPFLLEWMPHPGQESLVAGYPDWDDLGIAWWALGIEGKSAIPALARIISTPRRGMDDYSVWTESAKAISYLGPEAIGPMLTVATNLAGQHELWELLHNFGNMGTNGAPAVPALIHWAQDPDSWVRDGVVSALGEIGERPDLAVPVLTNALHDTDWMVRRDAAEALGTFAKDSAAVLPLLIETVAHPADWQARAGALSGLGKIQNQPEIVVPVIAPYLNADNSVLERYAAYALRDLGSEAGFQVLLQATNNPNIGDIIYEMKEKVRNEQAK